MDSIMGFSSNDFSEGEIRKFFGRADSRSPDTSRILPTKSGWLCFFRPPAAGVDETGMQPFTLDGDAVICSGKIRGFRSLRQLLSKKYAFESESDCEVLLPMFREYGLSMFARLDAEFAMVIYDGITDSLIAARDPFGIRPLFYGYDACGAIVFASEAKNLAGLCAKISPFPPGHYYVYGRFVPYIRLTNAASLCRDGLETVCRNS